MSLICFYSYSLFQFSSVTVGISHQVVIMDFSKVKKVMEEYDPVVQRIIMAGFACGLGHGTLNYYKSGTKAATSSFIMTSGIMGSAAFATFTGAFLVRKIFRENEEDDWINHGISWSLTGTIVKTVLTKNIFAGVRSGLAWGIAGSTFKYLGDIIFDGTRNKWLDFRKHHSLPIDDGTVRNYLSLPQGEEREEIERILAATWKLFRTWEVPEPTYGPLAKREVRRTNKNKPDLDYTWVDLHFERHRRLEARHDAIVKKQKEEGQWLWWLVIWDRDDIEVDYEKYRVPIPSDSKYRVAEPSDYQLKLGTSGDPDAEESRKSKYMAGAKKSSSNDGKK